MSISIETRENNISKSHVSAILMEYGQLFRDSRGYLHLRLCDGCVCIEDGQRSIIYSFLEFQNYSMYPFMKKCTPVEGTVKIEVELF